MYLDEFIETATILRDHGKLMGSARVYCDGFEIESIESNGFDLKLFTNREHDVTDQINLENSRAISVDSHVDNTNAVRDQHERTKHNGTEEEEGR